MPTGDVQFVDTSTNTPVGSATLANGKASLKAGESAAATVLGRPVAAIYSGDSNFKGSTSAPLPAIVNATASFSASFATDEIDSIFGIPGLKGDTPATIPLPDSLSGVTIKVTDSAGTDRVAPLYGAFDSANQVNFMIRPAPRQASPSWRLRFPAAERSPPRSRSPERRREFSPPTRPGKVLMRARLSMPTRTELRPWSIPWRPAQDLTSRPIRSA